MRLPRRWDGQPWAAHASDHGPGRHTCLKVKLLEQVLMRLHDPDPGLVSWLAAGVLLGANHPLGSSCMSTPSDHAEAEDTNVLLEHCWEVIGLFWRKHPLAEQLQTETWAILEFH